jgi:hypothetical protein
MRRMVRFAVHLYPAKWRATYGPEFDALLEEMDPGFGDLLNIVNGALLLQFNRLSLPLPIAACGLLGTCVAALVFFATPRRYASTSTIEILAADHATPNPAAVASLAFSDRNLASLIERMGLYPNEHEGRPVEEVIHRFREDVSVTLSTPEGPVRTEQLWNGQETVRLRDQGALHLSFTYPDRHKAQEVTGRLVSLVIDEALNVRAEVAAIKGAANDGIHYDTQFRVTSTPHEVPAGPGPMAVISLGLGAGLLAGVGIATLGHRTHLSH